VAESDRREGAQYPDAPLGTKFKKSHPTYGTESRILVRDEYGQALFRLEFPPDTTSDVGVSPGREWKVEQVGPSWVVPEATPRYGDVMAADTARDVLQNRLDSPDAEPSFRAAFLAGVRYARAKAAARAAEEGVVEKLRALVDVADAARGVLKTAMHSAARKEAVDVLQEKLWKLRDLEGRGEGI